MLNQEQLSCYQAQANVLYHALYFEPSDFLLGQFRDNEVAVSWPNTGEASSRSRGLGLLAQALDEPDEVLLPRLKRDYTELFIGPGELKAIPWGSPYLHEKRLLCGPSTEAFAAFCQHHGIQVTTQTKEPIDHMGLMLSVVASLLAEEAKQANGVAVKVAGDLLTEHLLPWGGRFCQLMAEGANTPYYQGIALLTTSLLEGLEQDLDLTPLSLQLFL
ncbi:molecular chaperone TorD [Ferrimonas sediminicola]|uniref:Molecular chaperone TorD n=1 Tax=Ferrimonas sediminicola TaxID=2569538 RepID=A0A4U1BK64_9GAMM|nr:molecular chaperone TorD family protein [Ferrimonas sediminicola]TKB50490.1 molecular chaperone TorD [Ferrimonas sediminicola]